MRPPVWLLALIIGALGLSVGFAIGQSGGSTEVAGADTGPAPDHSIEASPTPPPTFIPSTAPTPTPVPAPTAPTTTPPSDDQTATADPDPAPPAVEIRYAFPVQPPSAASYGRDHHDYEATDIFAPCGTTLVAPVSGVVDEVSRVDTWDPTINDPATRGGLSFAIVGVDGVRHYGSHLQSIEAAVVPGAAVQVGQVIGTLGRSGNARETPCHLHYGLSPPRGPGDWEIRRGVIFPWPYLDAWRDGSTTLSPADAIAEWATANP
ncbi:hypothetical protein BH23ACT9_BH23ACT9_31320 [soil metagenome]